MKWIKLDDKTVWPLDLDDAVDNNSINWTLRYGNPTRSDLLRAAEILSAYHALIRKTQKRRNEICKILQKEF